MPKEEKLPCDNYQICISSVDDCHNCQPDHYTFSDFFIGDEEEEQ